MAPSLVAGEPHAAPLVHASTLATRLYVSQVLFDRVGGHVLVVAARSWVTGGAAEPVVAVLDRTGALVGDFASLAALATLPVVATASPWDGWVVTSATGSMFVATDGTATPFDAATHAIHDVGVLGRIGDRVAWLGHSSCEPCATVRRIEVRTLAVAAERDVYDDDAAFPGSPFAGALREGVGGMVTGGGAVLLVDAAGNALGVPIALPIPRGSRREATVRANGDVAFLALRDATDVTPSTVVIAAGPSPEVRVGGWMAPSIDAALAATDAGYVAAYGDASGEYLQRLDDRGAPDGPPLRIDDATRRVAVDVEAVGAVAAWSAPGVDGTDELRVTFLDAALAPGTIHHYAGARVRASMPTFTPWVVASAVNDEALVLVLPDGASTSDGDAFVLDPAGAARSAPRRVAGEWAEVRDLEVDGDGYLVVGTYELTRLGPDGTVRETAPLTEFALGLAAACSEGTFVAPSVTGTLRFHPRPGGVDETVVRWSPSFGSVAAIAADGAVLAGFEQTRIEVIDAHGLASLPLVSPFEGSPPTSAWVGGFSCGPRCWVLPVVATRLADRSLRLARIEAGSSVATAALLPFVPASPSTISAVVADGDAALIALDGAWAIMVDGNGRPLSRLVALDLAGVTRVAGARLGPGRFLLAGVDASGPEPLLRTQTLELH